MQDNRDDIRSWYQSYPPEGESPASSPEDLTKFSPPASAEPSFSSPSSLYPSAGATPFINAAPKKRGKKRTGWKIVLIVLSVLVLIVASAVAFMDTNDGLFGFSITLRPAADGEGTAPADKAPDTSGQMPENYQDYFSGLFETAEDPAEGNTIPVAGAADDVAFTVSPAGTETYSLQEIYDACSPAIVSITAYADNGAYSWGTGVIFSSDGYIVTNAHILEGTSSVMVTLADDRQYEGRLIGSDSLSDIAVLSVRARGLPAAEFGNSDSLSVGDDVVAIGNPLGEELRGTMTNGIVSAINRDITHNGSTMTLIQTNAALNQGNSGGALINMHGQVVGITNMKMMSTYSSIEGIGFAIPSQSVKAIVDQLLDKGYVTGRPTIGITVGTMPEAAIRYYELPGTLIIESVTPGSDAEAQGLRSGDVIVSVEGQELQTSELLKALRDGVGIGGTLHFVIYRDGEYFEAAVQVMDANQLQ